MEAEQEKPVETPAAQQEESKEVQQAQPDQDPTEQPEMTDAQRLARAQEIKQELRKYGVMKKDLQMLKALNNPPVAVFAVLKNWCKIMDPKVSDKDCKWNFVQKQLANPGAYLD